GRPRRGWRWRRAWWRRGTWRRWRWTWWWRTLRRPWRTWRRVWRAPRRNKLRSTRRRWVQGGACRQGAYWRGARRSGPYRQDAQRGLAYCVPFGGGEPFAACWRRGIAARRGREPGCRRGGPRGGGGPPRPPPAVGGWPPPHRHRG